MPRTWKNEEDQYLLAHYGTDDTEFLARVLDRSVSAVRSRYAVVSKNREERDANLPLEFVLARAARITAKKLVVPAEIKGTIPTAKLSQWKGKKGNAYAHTKSGYRPDIGINCRSGWEANTMRVLAAYEIPFDFEPTVFTYPIKRGNKAYTPDIYLPLTLEWIEVKGYLDKNSEMKLKRFKKYYPKEFANLTMVIGKGNKKTREFAEALEVPTILYYEEISKTFRDQITTWEGK